MVSRIEIDVEKRLGGFLLAASFAADATGVIALFGASGAGKTSLIDMIAGRVRPDRGRIVVGDRVLFDSAAGIDRPPETRRAGYVFQDARLFPHLKVGANLRYGRRRAPRTDRAVSFDRVVGALDLAPLLDRRIRYLSGGERQRVAIGRALLTSPRILLMDEPLASLDPARRAEILPLIEHLRDSFAIPIVYVSHRLEEIVRLADTLVLMHQGTASAAGPLEEMISHLDERALGSRRMAGSVFHARVLERGGLHGSARLGFGGGTMLVPDPGLAVGAELRVHVRSRDVSIALSRPEDISVQNIFAGTIAEIQEPDGVHVDIGVRLRGADGTVLWARLTRHSTLALGLRTGQAVHALVKAVAIDPLGAGRTDWRSRRRMPPSHSSDR